VDNNAGPLGILAGGGTLPRRVAEAAAAQGRPVFIVAFAGQFDPATVEGFPHIALRIGEAGRIIAEMRKAGVVDLVMAGGVRRPSISELGLDWRGVQLFARIGVRALGDDGLLAAIGQELEREGFRLMGVSEILAGGVIPAGLMGHHQPDEQARADIAHGFEVARALGAVDIGQAVVVQQGLVLGVEAIEGTDALLRRVGPLKREGPGGVLVKVAKPQQDRRIDLPTIGPATVRLAAEAGLRGIAVEAGVTILLDQTEAVAAADAAGLFLIAIEPSQP
jgi:UDP-2,3-diacylglucosamine hydrolase